MKITSQASQRPKREKQKQLAFDTAREQARLKRVERLIRNEPRLTTGRRLFDEQAYREATRLAKGTNHA